MDTRRDEAHSAEAVGEATHLQAVQGSPEEGNADEMLFLPESLNSSSTKRRTGDNMGGNALKMLVPNSTKERPSRFLISGNFDVIQSKVRFLGVLF